MDDDPRTELDAIRIRGQADLQRLWELVMSPLGFRELSLWATFIGEDRRPDRVLVQVAEWVGVPEPPAVAHLFEALQHLRSHELPGSTVALLITRPGSGRLTHVDRELATRLTAAAADAGVPLEPLHVANDVRVLVVAPDDLAA
jgi:hypothetical protein